MEFLDHTLNWTKGEIFEAVIIAVFGILTIIIGFVFWKFGDTPNAKALLLPLIVVGGIFVGSGISMYLSNQKRLVEFEKRFKQDQVAFVQQEKPRVEDFQYLYTMTKILATAFFALALLFFWFTNNHYLQAVGIGLILFGLSGLVSDYFSKERADIYYELIKNELKLQN